MFAGIFLCSIGVLMQEILLTRIFSFTIWYHLAYLTISTALLGFGAAGSLLSAFPHWLARDPARFAARCAAAAGVALVLALWILSPFPLSPDRMQKAPFEFFTGLLFYYSLVAVPFTLAGLAVAAPLTAFPVQANRLYAADLFGAGLGCVGAVAALTWLDGAGAVFACAAMLVLGGAAYAAGDRLAPRLAALALALACAAPFAHHVLGFSPTPTKAMGMALRQPDTEILFTRWSPINRVDLYQVGDGRGGSFWAAYGRSRGFRGPFPRTRSIQYDAHNGTDVYEVRGPSSLALLDTHLLRTPYLLHERPRVLVIGVGGGIDVLNALRRGATRVTGVDLQPITLDLHRGPLAEWTGGEFQRPEVELIAAEGRHFVRSHPDAYDIVQITAVDTFSAQSTGAYVLAESYLYSVEAVLDYLDRLDDDGVLSVVLGDPIYDGAEVPSPLGTRLALVAREALRRRGAADPAAHIALVAQVAVDPTRSGGAIRGSIAGDLLVKKTPFTPDQLATLGDYARSNGFQVRYAKGGGSDAALRRLLDASDEELPRLLEECAFSLEPLTDDRPFFYHVLRWKSLLGGEDMLWYFPGSTTGQLMLLMMLAQAILLGGALIVLPLLRGAGGGLARCDTLALLLYFVGLGLGFLLIEISFVQKYVLILGYPTYSLSVTIFSLLVFAACGAALSRRFWARPRAFLLGLLAVTVALVAAEIALLPLVRDSLLAASLATRIAFTVLMQLPLGVALGMYFPTGLELVRRVAPRLVPWAWAVNGVASVASSVLAVILAMSIGFSGVALVAAGVYTIGTCALVLVLPRLARGAPGA
jgi:hypothetical protein